VDIERATELHAHDHQGFNNAITSPLEATRVRTADGFSREIRSATVSIRDVRNRFFTLFGFVRFSKKNLEFGSE